MNITNNISINRKNILRIFPYIKDKKKLNKLKIDDSSVKFITYREIASKISSILINYLNKINKTVDDIFITDATAGVGGNTISFAINFGFITAIELDDLRCNYLKNNLEIYELKNVKIICGDAIEELKNIDKQDIVFIDPPWGGINYKISKNLRLKLSEKSIEELCNELLNSNDYKMNPKIIVLKLPINYDFDYLYSNMKNMEIILYKLKKMYLCIVFN